MGRKKDIEVAKKGEDSARGRKEKEIDGGVREPGEPVANIA